MKKVTIVGVAGGSASGKTTIVRKIMDYFGEDIDCISHDSYYYAHDDLKYEERTKLNYDHPSSFETQKLVEDIKKIKAGQDIFRPEYDYEIHTRSHSLVLVKAKPVIIVEGILVLENKELRDLMDIKIYVDEDSDERLMRRIIRDTKQRARTLESVLTQYRETVKPMHERFIEPSKKYADIIIPRGGENTTAINIMIQHIQRLVEEHK